MFIYLIFSKSRRHNYYYSKGNPTFLFGGILFILKDPTCKNLSLAIVNPFFCILLDRISFSAMIDRRIKHIMRAWHCSRHSVAGHLTSDRDLVHVKVKVLASVTLGTPI